MFLHHRFLRDRNRGTQPGDILDVRFRELAEELARVTRQGLDVAALPFGVERVKGERTFTASAHTGKAYQTILRERQIDPIEVMLPRAFDIDHRRG